LIVDKFDFTNASYTAKNFFDKDILHFVAIDGTAYSNPLFDMVIFYAGAYSCDGSIEFSQQDNLKIKYQNRFIDQSLDISSCIPVYIDKIPEIDHTFHDKDGKVNSSILNYKIDDLPIDINDIVIARHNIIHDKLNLPSPREDYLRYAIFNLLSQENQELNTSQIMLLLKINNDEKTRNRIERYIHRSIEEGIIEKAKEGGKYKIVERYKFSWSRVKKLVIITGEKIFGEDKGPFYFRY
jgi:hypothetical protein